MTAHFLPFSANPLTSSSKLGPVSIPDKEGAPLEALLGEPAFSHEKARQVLAQLGRDLGLLIPDLQDMRGPEEEPSLKLTAFSDPAIRKTLAGTDMLWMRGEEIVALFVFEATPGPWDGLRRLGDLLALNPKLKGACYAITTEELKTGLMVEAHRPIYQLLKKPLVQVLRLLTWPRLHEEILALGDRVRYLKPEFLEGMSENLA